MKEVSLLLIYSIDQLHRMRYRFRMTNAYRNTDMFLGNDKLLLKLIQAHKMAVEQGHKRLAVAIEMAIVERQSQI